MVGGEEVERIIGGRVGWRCVKYLYAAKGPSHARDGTGEVK